MICDMSIISPVQNYFCRVLPYFLTQWTTPAGVAFKVRQMPKDASGFRPAVALRRAAEVHLSHGSMFERVVSIMWYNQR